MRAKEVKLYTRCGCKLHVVDASSRVKRLSWAARGREDAVEAEVEEEEEARHGDDDDGRAEHRAEVEEEEGGELGRARTRRR